MGGYLAIDGAPYDTVLSVVLLLAAVRLVMPAEMEAVVVVEVSGSCHAP